MVMGKVSKAIAAGFLCLSLFNSGGDFASAMNSKGPTTTLPTMSSKTEKNGPVQGGKPEEKKTDEKKPPKENTDEKKPPKENPDNEKKLSETAIRLIIGLVSGAGGLVFGTLLGKFAF